MGGQGGEGGASCEGKHMGDESKERIMRVLDIVGKTKEVQTYIQMPTTKATPRVQVERQKQVRQYKGAHTAARCHCYMRMAATLHCTAVPRHQHIAALRLT